MKNQSLSTCFARGLNGLPALLGMQAHPRIPPPMPISHLPPAGGTKMSTTFASALIVTLSEPSQNWGDPLFVTMRPSRLRTHRLRSPRRAVPPLNVFLFIIVYFVFYLGLPFVFCLLPCCPGVALCPGVTPRWHNSTRSMTLI